MGCIQEEISFQNRADTPEGHVGALELESTPENQLVHLFQNFQLCLDQLSILKK